MTTRVAPTHTWPHKHKTKAWTWKMKGKGKPSLPERCPVQWRDGCVTALIRVWFKKTWGPEMFITTVSVYCCDASLYGAKSWRTYVLKSSFILKATGVWYFSACCRGFSYQPECCHWETFHFKQLVLHFAKVRFEFVMYSWCNNCFCTTVTTVSGRRNLGRGGFSGLTALESS